MPSATDYDVIDPADPKAWQDPQIKAALQAQGLDEPAAPVVKQVEPLEGIWNVMGAAAGAIGGSFVPAANAIAGFPGQVWDAASAEEKIVQNEGNSFDPLGDQAAKVDAAASGAALTGLGIGEGLYNLPGEISNAYHGDNRNKPTHFQHPELQAAVEKRPLFGMTGSLLPYLAAPEAIPGKAGLAAVTGAAIAQDPGDVPNRGAARAAQAVLPAAGLLGGKLLGAGIDKLGRRIGEARNTAGEVARSPYGSVNDPMGIDPAARPQSNSFTETPLLTGGVQARAPYAGEGAGASDSVRPNFHRVTQDSPTSRTNRPDIGQGEVIGLLPGKVDRAVPLRAKAGELKARAQYVAEEAGAVDTNIDTPVSDAVRQQEAAAAVETAQQALKAAQQMRQTQEEGHIQVAKQAMAAAQTMQGEQQAAAIQAATQALEAAKQLQANESAAATQYAQTVIEAVQSMDKSPPRINPATGKPIPKGAQMGFSLAPEYVAQQLGERLIKVSDAMSPKFTKSMARYFNTPVEAGAAIIAAFISATTVLGQEALVRVGDATLTTRQVLNAHVEPLKVELQKIKYDVQNPNADIEGKINKLFKDNDLIDIQSGAVTPQMYDIPQELNGAIQLVAKGLTAFPKILGFKGLDRYDFRKGFTGGKAKLIFDVNSGAAQMEPRTPREMLNSSIAYHRDYEGLPPDDRSVFSAYMTHADKMARQHAWAPLLRDTEGRAIIDADGKYDVAPNSHFEYMQNIIDNKPNGVWGKAKVSAARFVLDSVIGAGSKTAFDRAIRYFQYNALQAVLNHRITAGLKNFPAIFAQSTVPITDLVHSLTDVLSNPMAERILKKHGPKGYSSLERLRLGVFSKEAAGLGDIDAYRIIEQYATDVAFWGKILEESKKQNISLETIEKGTDPIARKILVDATIEIKNTQGVWSRFDGRPASANSFGSAALLFKNPRLTETEIVVGWAKEQNWGRLARYFGTKFLVNGPANVIDKTSAAILLGQVSNMPPWLRGFLEDARSGGMVAKVAQEALPDNMNVSLPQSIATPMLDAGGVPVLSEGLSLFDSVPRQAGTIFDPQSTGTERAVAIGEALSGPSALAPMMKVGPFAVSPKLALQGATSIAKSTMPGERYGGEVVPIDPASEVARMGLSGNMAKNEVKNYADDSTQLKKDLHDAFLSKDQKRLDNAYAQLKGYVDEHYDTLKSEYKIEDKNELIQKLTDEISGDVEDKHGNVEPTQKEWGRVIQLYEAADKAKSPKQAEAFNTELQGEWDRMKAKYTKLKPKDLQTRLDRYDSRHK